MKVDSPAISQPPVPDGVDGAPNTGMGQPSQAAQTETDRVTLSTKAELLAEALREAEQTPAIREALVVEMRQRLADGDIGDDAVELADSMIDRLLTR